MKTALILTGGLPTLLAANPLLAQDCGDRVENRLDRKDDRVETRLDQRGDRVNRRVDRRHGGDC